MAFGFTTLTGTETAGWNSINALITSIDTQLDASNRLIFMSGTPSNGQSISWDASNARWSAALLTDAALATGAVTASKLASTLDLSSKTVTLPATSVTAGMLAGTLDLTGKTVTVATASAGDNDTSVASTAFVTGAISTAVASVTAGTAFTVGGDLSGTTGDAQIVAGAVGTTELANANVTYAKLAADAKTYSMPSAIASSVDLSSSNLSSASAQQPFVTASNASTAIVLSLPNYIGTAGDTITICQTGAAAVTIAPKTGATATINGSTSNTYTLGGLYSVVTLVCLSNSGSNGTWIITGDYI